MKLNAELNERVIVDGNAIDWVPSPTAGVQRRMLERDGEEVARATTLVQFEENTTFPQHSHGGGEEFFVLENIWDEQKSGSFIDHECEYRPGYYVRHPIDSEHQPFTSRDQGCLLFVKLRQMTDRTEQVLVVDTGIYNDYDDNTGSSYQQSEKTTNSHQVVQGQWNKVSDTKLVMPLFYNQSTNERVCLEKWLPGHMESTSEAEEIFILKGLMIEDTRTFSQNYWIRTPSKCTDRMRYSNKGCIFYKKTGLLP